MDSFERVFYFGMWILSIALAGICVFQITQDNALYAGGAAAGFVVTYTFALDGMLLHYFERIHGNVESTLRILKNKKPQ